MTTKHSPGPWLVVDRKSNSKELGEKRTVAITANHSIVAQGGTPLGSSEEYLANANLIASAPELLAALKVARLLIEEEWVGVSLPNRGADALATIDAAIAKARGGA